MSGAAQHTIVLIDQDWHGDHRVERILADVGTASVLDLRATDRLPWGRRALDLLRAVGLALRSLRGGLTRRRMLAEELRPLHHPFAGLPACLRWTARAVAAARELDQAAAAAQGGAVRAHANDLAAALAVALSKHCRSLSFVYDSHELQVHRNRRAGWLRIIVEHAQERMVVDAAHEVRTVNSAVAGAMQRLHPSLGAKPPRISTSDYYSHHELVSAPQSGRPAIVYVGRATLGRQLERLGEPSTTLAFDVHGWLLGDAPVSAPQGGTWRRGEPYEAELAALRRQRRCLMWCCLDSRSLSYRLATPNKFFQALALGIPVVATPGTYLAEVVEEHGIGAIDDGDLQSLAIRARGPQYVGWLDNVGRFRRDLRAGRAHI